MTTLTREQWERKETADWWSAAQARRRQIYGAATEMMLEVAAVQPGSRVLDVAAGTGEQTLMAARRVGPTGYVLATDQSSSMLNVAAEAARKEGLTNVETRVMNAENLALDADSFDAVICRMGLMLFPNPAKVLSAMRRVVKLGGKVAVIVHSALERIRIMESSELLHASETYPLQRQENPGCLHSETQGALEDVYKRAGFLNVPVHTVAIQRRFASTGDAIHNMQNSVGDTRELMNRLNEAQRESAYVEIQEQLSRFEGSNGLEVPGEVLIGVGTK